MNTNCRFIYTSMYVYKQFISLNYASDVTQMSVRMHMDSNMIKVPEVCWIQFWCIQKYCTKRGTDTKFSDKAENN